MRYLVATDRSEEAENAIQYAVRQAIDSGAEIEIVHVLEPEPVLRDGEIVLPGGDKSIEFAESTVERARELAAEVAESHAADVQIDTEILTGRPAHAIAEYAEDTGIDAIYVGHRGLSEQQEQQLGSVAKTLLGKVTLPVTVVR